MAGEKEKLEVPSPDDSSFTLPPSKDLDSSNDREFAAINPSSNAASRTNSRGTARKANGTSLRTISRTRSNNGYGCCEGNESSEDIEGGEAEKDEWEVRWDGGDRDPGNPRSMAFGRKWLVVIIVSMSSLCV
jgi:hypothetical protein